MDLARRPSVETGRGGFRNVFAGAVALGLSALASGPLGAQGVFVRGDCNQDVELNISDPIAALSYLFLGGAEPLCLDACDADDSEGLEITDAIYVLSYLFLGGPEPLAPYPLEDLDPSGDALSCRNGRYPPRELIVLPPELDLYGRGSRQALSVSVREEGAEPVDVRVSPSTIYATSDPAVATVDAGGVVAAAGFGECLVSVRYRGSRREVPVRVFPGPLEGLRIFIASPPEGAAVASEEILVSGYATDRAAEVRVGEVEAENRGGFFSARTPLEPGPNAIEVRATSPLGEARATVRVVRVDPGDPSAAAPDGLPWPALPELAATEPDATPPAIAILAPANGAVLASGEVEVSGTVDDPEAEVRVGGTLAAIEGGTFRARVRLPPGPATIVAEAVDPVGNTARAEVSVTVDAALPAVAFVDPAGDPVAVVASERVSFRGTVQPSGAAVVVGGVPARVQGSTWTAGLELGAGWHDVAASVSSGSPVPRRASAVRAVVVDRSPPAVELAHPGKEALGGGGFRTVADRIRVAGRAFDPGVPLEAGGAVTVEVAGAAAPSGGGSFAAQAALSLGVNLVAVRARDARGQETSLTLRVERVAPAEPHLAIVSGDGQTAAAGQTLSEDFVVEARDRAGNPEPRVPVRFAIVQGGGALEGGVRALEKTTGADGRARVRATAPDAAGAAGLVVRASAPGRTPAAVAFAVEVVPGPERILCARGRRSYRGVAGLDLPERLEVRLVDARGNPISGETVTFRAVEGDATIAGGSPLAVATDAFGIARARVALPRDRDSRSVVEASRAPARPVRLEVFGLRPGPAADTEIAGAILDPAGQPLPGAVARVAGTDLAAAADSSGAFRLRGAPWGFVLLEIAPPPAGLPGGRPSHAGTAVRAFAVPGRPNPLDAPVRLVPFPSRVEGGGPEASRGREEFVSSTRGALLAVPALPGTTLEVEPGAAKFPDGAGEGIVAIAAPNLSVLPVPVPDDGDVDAAVSVLPEGARFDPPARLRLPSPWGARAGELVPAFALSAGAGGFLEIPGAVVDETGSSAVLDGARGIGRGGVFVAALRGPRAGATGALAGRVETFIPGFHEVPEREESAVVGVNVYAHSGEFYLEEVDLELPLEGRGLPFAFRRRYESRHNFRGSLGWNWEHEYDDRRLRPGLASGNVVRATGRGRFDEYLWAAETGAFVSPVGVFSRLSMAADGSLIERDPDGTRYRYHPLDGSPLAGRLESIEDRKGNRLSFRRDARGLIEEARDPVGRRVTYARDAEGRIESVRDFSGRIVRFEYSPEGDLVAVTRPAVTLTPSENDFPEGKRREYVYSTGRSDGRLDHNLLEVIDPREVSSTRLPRLRIAYEEDLTLPSADRVVSQVWGGTNATGVPAGGTFAFRYEIFAGDPPPFGDADALESFLLSAAGRTRVVDPEGRSREILWSGAGLPLSERIHTVEGSRPRDPRSLHPPPGIAPPYYETRWAWSREGLLLEKTSPRGDRLLYAYDEASPVRWAQAHLLRVEHRPAPRASAGARPAVTTYLRDPLFGVAVLEIPPRGNDPGSGGEGPSPERFATRRYLDYQEGASLDDLAAAAGLDAASLADALDRSGISLGLGDLNADGVEGPARGDVLREEPPAATLPDGSSVSGATLYAYNRFGQLVSRKDPAGREVRFEYHPERDPDGDGTPSAEPDLDAETGGFLARTIADVGVGERRDLVVESFRYDERGYLASRTDGDGNVVFTAHNSLGQLVEVRWGPPLRYRRHYLYDADDNLVKVRVENFTSTDGGTSYLVSGNRWIDAEFERDILGRVVAATREVSEGEVGPARSVTTRYRYHPAGALARAIHPVPGTDETWERDERDLVVREVRGAGTADESVREFFRDEGGEVVLEVEPDADGDGEPEVTERRYDGFGRLAATIDAVGGATVFERDVEGRIVSESVLGSPGGPSPSGRGGEGNALLRRRVYAYDERGELAEAREHLFVPGASSPPTALRTQHFRDAAGRLIRRTDPDGGVWTWTYDNAGRLVREEAPDGSSKAFALDGRGNPVREVFEATSPEPVQPEAAGDPDYDASGRLRETRTVVRAYDALGRLTILVEDWGGVWRARYDSANRMVFASDAEGSTTVATADPELTALAPLLTERQLSNLNADGNRRRFVYDNLGRLVEAAHELRAGGGGGGEIDVTNPFNRDGLITERFEWDDDGRLVAWTDDAGNRTSVEYDSAGYLRKKTWPDGTFETYERDRRGRLRAFVDANGTRIVQRFDKLGRVVERTVERAAGVEGTARQAFEHDGLSRPTLALDENDPGDPSDDALLLRAYDSLGRLVEEVADGFSVSYEYDAASRLVALRYPDGRRVELRRDSAGRVAALAEGGFVHVASKHLGSGLLREKRLAPGLALSFLRRDREGILRPSAYDRAGEIVERLYEWPGGETPLGYEYGRKRSGLPSYERRLHVIGDTSLGTGIVWAYDSVYRVFVYLPRVFDPRFPPDDPLEKLVFYPDGNHSWRYLLVNFSEKRLTVNPRSAYVTSGDASFSYDSSGSLVASGDLRFAYDAFRRLVRAERGGAAVARQRYDAWGAEGGEEFLGRGRRVAKEVLAPVEGQPAGTLRQVYSGERLIEERAGDGNLLRQYLWGGEGLPEVLLVRRPSHLVAPYYVLHDGLGSVRGVVSLTGAVEERYEYGLYGTPSVKDVRLGLEAFPPLGGSLAFGCAIHDYELGWHLVGARHFDPNLGRYVSEASPWLPREPLSLNGYLAPPLPGMTGEIVGSGSRTRRAPHLEPFRVRIGPARDPAPEVLDALPAAAGRHRP